MKMDEEKNQTARKIAEFTWAVFALDWEETVDDMNLWDFQEQIRKML